MLLVHALASCQVVFCSFSPMFSQRCPQLCLQGSAVSCGGSVGVSAPSCLEQPLAFSHRGLLSAKSLPHTPNTLVAVRCSLCFFWTNFPVVCTEGIGFQVWITTTCLGENVFCSYEACYSRGLQVSFLTYS